MENKKTFLEKIKEIEENQAKRKAEKELNKSINPTKNRFVSFFKKLLLIIVILFFSLIAFGMYLDSQKTPEQREAEKKQYEKEKKEYDEKNKKEKEIEDAKNEEEKLDKAQFNCTSHWDGSVPDVVNAVKNNLRDPSSFEHIETKVSLVSKDDEQVVIMKYRARNGFGGMNVESVVALIKNSNCTVKEIKN